jgi:hypothetical protein
MGGQELFKPEDRTKKCQQELLFFHQIFNEEEI